MNNLFELDAEDEYETAMRNLKRSKCFGPLVSYALVLRARFICNRFFGISKSDNILNMLIYEKWILLPILKALVCRC